LIKAGSLPPSPDGESPENSSNKAGFQAGFDFFPRHGRRRIAVVMGKAGFKEMLLLGA
jgi:hypothetical protein